MDVVRGGVRVGIGGGVVDGGVQRRGAEGDEGVADTQGSQAQVVGTGVANANRRGGGGRQPGKGGVVGVGSGTTKGTVSLGAKESVALPGMEQWVLATEPSSSEPM